MKYDLTKFKAGMEDLGISLSDHQYDQYIKYYEMILEKNKVMNLTAITEFDEVIEKHFIDSLSLIKVVNFDETRKVLDLGTGAGLPGIPIKIAFPKLDIVLMDSLNKRVVFLKEVIDALGLQNIDAVHGRAEEAARKIEYRESFDLCVSRAVANLSSLCEYCIPFVALHGFFVSYKSGDIDQELEESKRAVNILGGRIDDMQKFQLPGTEMNRSFVKIKKVKKTPKGYPRKAGTPSKTPIR